MADTIFALSSGNLPSGVAVIRLSGPDVRFGLETICGRTPVPRNMTLVSFRDFDSSVLDRGLVAYFPAPNSFSGEDCAEFHLHGSKAVVRKFLEVLATLPGFRSAEAGEFTKRAFMNGKLDLTAAEGLADLIAAETEMQRKFALAQAEGGLRRLYEGWRVDIIRLRAMLEAAIEFSEEDDVGLRALASLESDVAALAKLITDHLGAARFGEIIRDGFQVAILGAPNAGKSSLLNALARREVAIASDEAGTTRDVIEVRLDMQGQLVVIADTAGLRESTSKIEQIGVSRALERGRSADLILAVYNAADPVFFKLDGLACPVVRVGTHADRLAGDPVADYDVLLSSVTGVGIDVLEKQMSSIAINAASGHSVVPVRLRQIELLKEAVSHLSFFGSVLDSSPDLAAEELRLCGLAIGRLTGVVDVEDLLDVVFSTFCIGK